MSIFNSLMAEAAEVLTDVLGERDEHGGMAVVSYWLPGNTADPKKWTGCIVGKMSVQEVADEHGNVVIRETVQLSGLATDDINRIWQKAKFKLPSFGDRVWVPQQSGSEESGGWLVYQLERKPLMKMDDKTDARAV